MRLKTIIRQHIMNNEGFTYNLHHKTPETGYMVGGFSKVTEVQPGYAADYGIKEAIQRFKMIKELNPNPNFYLGGWFNAEKDLWELETFANILNRKEAIAVGRFFNQLSIWDLDNSKEIRL